jgi:hypothetical protein
VTRRELTQAENVTSSALQIEEFFVFVNLNNFICWHNLRFTKSMASAGYASAIIDESHMRSYLDGSADHLPYIPNPNRSQGAISLFSLSVFSDYSVEYDAEYVRGIKFRSAPSRMSALYAFKEMSDCRKANELYGWPLDTVRRFHLKRDPLTKVHRANMEIVSLMRLVNPMASWSQEHKDAIWESYWSGVGEIEVGVPSVSDGIPSRQTIRSGVIWEYLIEGRLELAEPL